MAVCLSSNLPIFQGGGNELFFIKNAEHEGFPLDIPLFQSCMFSAAYCKLHF